MNKNDLREIGQNGHFWYQARQGLLARLIADAFADGLPGRNILEVGAGLGEETGLLTPYGRVISLDNDAETVMAARRLGRNILHLDIEREKLPEKYGAACLFDVLEHLDNDAAALKKLRNALEPGGLLLFTVPAFPALFSGHDRASGHRRRYTRRELRAKLLDAGFSDTGLYYWNSLLFPLEAAYRLLKKAKRAPDGTDAKPLPPWLNAVLRRVLEAETKGLFKSNLLPFGLTIYGRARV
jgi:SAM-dependent methyltransferase